MNAVTVSRQARRPGCVAVESVDWADLARIYDTDVNLCVIHREPDEAVRTFIGRLLAGTRDIELAEAIAVADFDFGALLPEFRGLPGYPDWTRDLARLTEAYCELLGTERVGLRLRALDRPMCPRFHVDHVPCRLVCTYGGPGTEWLPDHRVDRSKLGPGAGGLPDACSGLILDDTAIRAMPPYAIGLMKGARWEGNEDHGAVHRSPALTGRQRRLLLSMDAL